MGGQADDPSQHDRPVPSELVEGALVRVVAPNASLPVGSEGTIIRTHPTVRLVVVSHGDPPAHAALADHEIVVVSPPG